MNEEIDYNKLYSIHRDYIFSGVNRYDVYRGETKSGDAVIQFPIAGEILSQLRTLHTSLYYSWIYKAKHLAISPESYKRRKQLIAELGLEKFEILILILLEKAPWGVSKERKEKNHGLYYKEAIKTVKDIFEIFNSVKNEAKYRDALGDIDNPAPEWILESVSFKYRYQNGSKKDQTISIKNDNTLFIVDVMNDYLKILNGFGTDIERRFSYLIDQLEKLEASENARPKITHQHKRFTYNFISFLKENQSELSVSIESTNALYRIYDLLLSEAGGKINSDANRIKNIQNWYSEGELLVSDFQRNNSEITFR